MQSGRDFVLALVVLLVVIVVVVYRQHTATVPASESAEPFTNSFMVPSGPNQGSMTRWGSHGSGGRNDHLDRALMQPWSAHADSIRDTYVEREGLGTMQKESQALCAGHIDSGTGLFIPPAFGWRPEAVPPTDLPPRVGEEIGPTNTRSLPDDGLPENWGLPSIPLKTRAALYRPPSSNSAGEPAADASYDFYDLEAGGARPSGDLTGNKYNMVMEPAHEPLVGANSW